MRKGSVKKEKVPNPFPIRTSGPILPRDGKYSPPTFGRAVRYRTFYPRRGMESGNVLRSGTPGSDSTQERRLRDVEVLSYESGLRRSTHRPLLLTLFYQV